jgi:hypothetical protein
MRPAPGQQTGSDLLRWMDPIAGDAIAAGYAHVDCGTGFLTPLARCHAMLWRRALNGQDDAGAFRRELSRLARLAGVSEALVEQVNRQILAELLDTVAQRYSRSPREAGAMSFEVARAACRIAMARPSRHSEPNCAAAELALAKQGA